MFEQNIVLVQLNWRGEVNAVGGGAGYSAKRNLVDAQLAAKHGRRRIEIARWLIYEKITAGLDTLRDVLDKSPERDTATMLVKKSLKETVAVFAAAPLATLLGIEGRAASAYFRSWYGLPLRWSGLKRTPIPESWREIGPRVMGWRDNSRNARHPLNAMLNYGYGMLAGQVRIQAVAAGLDPSIGIMHGNKNNRIPLVYDLMEPLRPVVDCQILKFVRGHTFTPGDFTINEWGGCRLNPQMAKVVAAQVSGLKADRVVTDFLKFLR